jgi:nitrite reductase/ring-hydroxylating ferredoxin subunit
MDTISDHISDLPQSWFPIYISSRLKKGQLVPIDILDSEWLLFRSKRDDQLGFVERFCPHMGTDLANGSVEGCNLVCPLHRLKFNVSDTGMSRGSGIKRLKTTEKYGLIFVFLGKEALFDLPEIDSVVSPMYSDPLLVRLDNNYLAVSLNTFDTQHFEFVHNRDVSKDVTLFKKSTFHLGIIFSVKVKLVRWVDYVMNFLGYSESELKYEMWGDNLAYGRNMTTRQNFLAMLSPGITKDRCNFYIVAAQERWSKNIVLSWIQRYYLNLLAQFGKSFLAPDFPVIKNMQPKAGNLLPDKDKAVRMFWEHKNALPIFRDIENTLWE